MSTKTNNPADADEANPAVPKSSSERVLGVMDLFTESKPNWTIESISKRLGLARTTAYRYLRTLVDAGFLASLNSGVYVLGPRIIQLDRQIRLNDPMLMTAPPLMEAIREKAAGIQVLCSYYGDHVLCIHDVRVDNDMLSGFDRGRPFPLFRGAPSRVILAHLPQRQLKDLMLNHAPDIASAGLGQNWQEFNQKLKLIRQAGYYAAPGDIHPDSYGIGAPIMHTKGVAGSLTIGRRLINLKEREIPYLIELAVDTAAQISTTIQAIQAKTKNETAD
jgi:DNA-binding IclR family transcriptional regulator